jgi:hypothetical protein
MTRRVCTTAYAAAVLLATTFLYARPNYGWDVLPYSAVALAWDNPDPDSVHAQAYAAVRRELRPSRYALLVDTTNAYRRQALRDPAFFTRELSFYSIKPLFVAMVHGLSRLGIPVPRATILPSLVAFVVVAGLLLAWTRRHIPEPYAAGLSLCILFSPFILYSAAASTPDLLSTALLLGGTWGLIEGRFTTAGLLLLALAVPVRLDALLFVIAMAVYLDRFRVVPRPAIAATVGAAALTAGLILLRHPEVAGRLFVVLPDTARAGEVAPASFAAYFGGLRAGLVRFGFSAIWLALALALITIYARAQLAAKLLEDRITVLVLVVLGHIALRFLLHPTIEHRFLIADYVLLWIAFLAAFRKRGRLEAVA